MGQIVSSAAKPKRCNANQLGQVPTPAAGEYILVSSDNSMNAAGQGYFDSYIIGDGSTAATALPLHYINKIDRKPTSGSDNAVASGGVYDVVEPLRDAIRVIENQTAFYFTDGDGNVIAKIDSLGVNSAKFNICDANGNVLATITQNSLQKLDSLYENGTGISAFSDGYGNIICKLDRNGVNAKKFNVCDENGNILYTIDQENFDGSSYEKSSWAGKHFCSLGDSIAYQNKWQPFLVDMFRLDYDVNETRNATHPLGIGGATICPKIRIETTPTPYPCYDDQQNQLTDAQGNPLYFHTGQGVDESIFIRADYLASLSPDLVVINGGTNDELNYSYMDAGTPSDQPYEGKQYVIAAYAVVAKYYGGANHKIAILDDGSAVLDAEYTGGNYTILSAAPTLCSCVAGMIKKICTGNPTAKVIGNSIMRYNRDLDNEREATVNKKNAIVNTYNHYGVPVANMWDELGVNVFNYESYYGNGTTDPPATSVHPNELGGKRMAEVIAQHIQ